MKKNGNKFFSILRWLFLLAAIGLFCLQIGYLLVHDRFQVEYIDNRLFYIINIIIVICLYLAILLLFTFTKRVKVIGAAVLGVFMAVQFVLLMQSNKEIKNIVSISPDFQHVFSVKENVQSGEALYYRSYYGILARPKEDLPRRISDDEYDVKWLADDVAAFTYQTNEGHVQQFIGTYGDRDDGLSYYYVGAEMQGVWQDGDMEVVSDTEGIRVTENGETALFEWDQIEQFGTLAIVLQQDQEAAWTIALNKDFKMRTNTPDPPSGSISLYKAAIGNEKSHHLKFKSPND